MAAADTDIFILLLYAFIKIGPAEKSYMKVDKERYVDISKVCKSYGKVIPYVMSCLPATVLQGVTQHLMPIKMEK